MQAVEKVDQTFLTIKKTARVLTGGFNFCYHDPMKSERMIPTVKNKTPTTM